MLAVGMRLPHYEKEKEATERQLEACIAPFEGVQAFLALGEAEERL